MKRSDRWIGIAIGSALIVAAWRRRAPCFIFSRRARQKQNLSFVNGPLQSNALGTDIRLRISTASGSERGRSAERARYRSRY